MFTYVLVKILNMFILHLLFIRMDEGPVREREILLCLTRPSIIQSKGLQKKKIINGLPFSGG